MSTWNFLSGILKSSHKKLFPLFRPEDTIFTDDIGVKLAYVDCCIEINLKIFYSKCWDYYILQTLYYSIFKVIICTN